MREYTILALAAFRSILKKAAGDGSSFSDRDCPQPSGRGRGFWLACRMPAMIFFLEAISKLFSVRIDSLEK